MPRLLEISELDFIAEIIDSIPYYGKSWNKMDSICASAGIDLEFFHTDQSSSKIKCLKIAFRHFQKLDGTDNRLYHLIKNAIPVAKARNDAFFRRQLMI